LIGVSGIAGRGSHLLEFGALGSVAGEKEETPAEFGTGRFRFLSARREEDTDDREEIEMASVLLHY